MDIKKIAFIEAGSPGFQMLSRYTMSRVGSALLATILAGMGCQVRAFIENIAPVDWDYVGGADLVCISALTNTVPRAYAAARKAGKLGMPVVMGGVHPTFMPEEALGSCDYVIRGEGERALAALVESLRTGSPSLDRIPGLSYRRKDGGIAHNPQGPLLDERALDALPDPDFSLVRGWKPSFIYPVSTSRGCPFDCSFCSVVPMFGRRYRFKSVPRVLSELKRIRRINRGTKFFVDDNFTADKRRSKELLRAMIDEGLKETWVVQARADVARDPELLNLMVGAGVHTVYVGFESINPRTLEEYNKKQELKDIENCIRAVRDHGMHIHGMFVVGADADDTDTVRRTLDFAVRNGLDTIQIIALTPLPGTKVFEQMKAGGRILHTDWSKYNLQHVVFRPARMSPEVLQMETGRANVRFYSWRYILKRLARLDFHYAAAGLAGRQIMLRTLKDSVNYVDKLNLLRPEDASGPGAQKSNA
ncbi:MAG: radical SAM protein [Nitrospiraceae bacterium]|nr:radical SAM protein [Nitrospiraceae bacterium]